jgi:hypothetical protein
VIPFFTTDATEEALARAREISKKKIEALPRNKSESQTRRRRGSGVRKQAIESKAIEIVKLRYPDARLVTYLETRDFMDGKFVSLSYKFPGEQEEELIYIYFDELDSEFAPRVCEMEDEFISLANDLGVRRSSSIGQRTLDYIFREGGAAVVIALILMTILLYSVVRGIDLGTQFWNLLLLVVGFYFGSNAPKREKL